jgi:hypothetical protein
MSSHPALPPVPDVRGAVAGHDTAVRAVARVHGGAVHPDLLLHALISCAAADELPIDQSARVRAFMRRVQKALEATS